ncbi:hypothetical protein, partial [Telluria aromaticivorans]|uniref:hypothetical protein n=1 Tax=Telluria aromaticivorans TaxID=2725995 RepID=UPI001BB2B099
RRAPRQRRKHPLKSECDFWKTDILTLLKADISTLLLQGGQVPCPRVQLHDDPSHKQKARLAHAAGLF